MIQPQELRIGNLVEYNGLPMNVSGIHSPKPLKDNRFSDKWIIELFDGAGLIDVTIDEVKAIPISEEWLLNFNFGQGGYDLLIFSIEELDLYGLDNHFAFNYDLGQLEIKVVHELQNLYHLLTDKELTLTK